MRDRSCHPCLRTLLPRGGEKICIIDQDTFQTWSNVVHFAPSPDRFACSRKKAIRFLCMPFATILLILQPFWLHIFLSHIYIFFLHQSILLFFLFLFPFSFSHLSPPLPFFSVFLMLAHRSNHLFTYSFIYPRFLFLLEHWIILLIIRPITVSDRYFFLNLLSILLVEYYTRYDAKFLKKFF